MNIVSTQYSLKYKSFEIYLSGCDGYCNGCHNEELWDFGAGTHYKEWLPRIQEKVNMFPSLVEYIWVLGGEPLLQNKTELMDLLSFLQELEKKTVLWTRFSLEDVKKEGLLEYLWAVKVGEYREELAKDNYFSNGIQLASTNQKLIILKEEGN